MGKPARRVTPDDRALQDRIARARAGSPPIDPLGVFAERCKLLGAETGVGWQGIYELWSERAGHREHDANVSRGEAEELAFGDVVGVFRKQGSLLR